MIDTRTNKDILRTGEKPPSPVQARKDVIDQAVGHATLSMAPFDVLSQPLPPIKGAYVEPAFKDRRDQHLTVAPDATEATTDQLLNSQDTYIAALTTKESTPVGISEMSANASSAVMRAAVEDINFPAAA